MNSRNPQDYVYDPATGTYIPARRRSPMAPPLPPKELDPFYSTITKESQQLAELDGGIDAGSSLASSESPPAPRGGDKEGRERAGRVKFNNVGSKKRRQLRILSLDGGGIRGYSTLVILQELMHQIYVQTHKGKGPRSPSDLPRPCDYFDLIGGTGTGGLIALMLGRMRMDVESCKEYYVQLTRFVFITDKTLMGVPYGKTLFKASRLEDAIKHCVQESTASETNRLAPDSLDEATTRSNSLTGRAQPPSRRTSSYGRSHTRRSSASTPKTGNPDAPLFDDRPNRCPTVVTAVYQGTPPNSTAPPALLRTYPSAAESVPSYNCTIWQAGRATSATLSAFKPITIGQNTFLDEGSGKYNPAIAILEEARHNQFPDDDISLFVSVGTGKPPTLISSQQAGQHHHHHHHQQQQQQTHRNPLVQTHFAEARKRAQSKLSGAEAVHRALLDGEDGGRPELAKNGVARENYYRFNVEVGVGEFALNEWNRLTEVSTGTRRYLQHPDISKLVRDCAAITVNIEKAKKKELEEGLPVAVPSGAPLAELGATEKETGGGGGGGGGGVGFPIGRVHMPDHRHHLPGASPPPHSPQRDEHPYFRVSMPNPEIRVTSPTVAGGDDDDERYHVPNGRRRR